MQNIHNFGKLILFILRRDRLYLPLWIIGLTVLAIFFVPMLPDFLGDDQSKSILVEMMKNPAMVAMIGILYGDSSGALFAMFMLVWSTLAVGIFNILFVIRHTRKDEEEGRNELIAALPVGRSANLLAVLLIAFAANVGIALLSAITIPLFGVDGIEWRGALVFSAAIGAGGFVFASITALLAQLFASSKTATAWAFVILGVAYLLRAVGDINSSYEIAALLSPLGMIERVQAWVSNEIWPLIILLAEAVCISAVASLFSFLRDTGSGVFPQQAGRVHASMFLASSWGLAWRLTRSLCIGWAITMFVLGASYGSIFNDMSGFIENNELYALILSGGTGSQKEITDAFVSFIAMMMAIISAIPVCMVITKLKSEEAHGRLEQVLAQSVNKAGLMSGFVLISITLSVVLILLTPLGMYSSAAMMMDSPPDLGMMIKSSLNYLPAVVAMAGLAAVLTGALPKLTPVIWVFIAFCFLLAYIGNILESSAAGETMQDVFNVLLSISPFSLLPMWPAHEINIVLSVGMIAVAVVLVGVGLTAYRRRDIFTV